MKELTKAESQIMQYIWKLEKAFLKDIVEQFPDPKPAYTTVSTVIRVLVKKEFLAFNTYGKVHEYYPLVSKREYSKKFFKNIVKNFFNGSAAKFTSFFTSDDELSLTELQEIKNIVEQQIEERKKSEE